jgi:hypothetical protein
LLLLGNESNTQHVPTRSRRFRILARKIEFGVFGLFRMKHSRPVLGTCCVFDSFLSRSKSFSITRGTHSRPVLGTCCVFDSSLSRTKSFSFHTFSDLKNGKVQISKLFPNISELFHSEFRTLFGISCYG